MFTIEFMRFMVALKEAVELFITTEEVNDAPFTDEGQWFIDGQLYVDHNCAHCSIEGEKVTQLLAKYNQPVSKEDYDLIMGHLKTHGLVKKDSEAGWGNPYNDNYDRF